MASVSLFLGLISVFLLSANRLTHASSQIQSVLSGSEVEIRCASSVVPPFWTFTHPKESQPKTLAFSGTQLHPDLKDSRFTFTESDSVYVLKISGIELKDVGNYNCHGDKLQQTLVNVVR